MAKGQFDVCVIDYFPQNFINEHRESCILKEKADFDIKQISTIPQGHGIAILQLMKIVNPQIKWGIIPITPDMNLGQINNQLSYLIENKIVKIINVSFGFYKVEKTQLARLSNLCRKAKEEKISIVCAAGDKQQTVYPADLKTVIRVTGVDKIKSEKDMEVNGRNVYVKNVSFRVRWTENRRIWVHGSSFYAGIVSALLSSGSNDGDKIENLEKFCFGAFRQQIEFREGKLEPFDEGV